MKFKSSMTYLLIILFVLSILVFGCAKPTTQTSNEPKQSEQEPKKEQQKAEPIVVKFSHPAAADESDPLHRAALLMEKKVEEYSNGKVDVKIYPGGQLGSEQRNVQDLQNGIIPMALVTANNVTPFSPSIGIFDFPYIFKDRNDTNKVIDAIWDDLNTLQIKESQTRTLSWLEQGYRVLSNSKKPVLTIDDLKGLKIRVPNNKYMIETFKAWGCDPTPMAWDEVFNALQQKVIDGQENPYASLWVSKNYEVQKYVTDIHYKMWIGTIMVDENWFKTLPKDLQDAFIKAGRDVTEDNRKYMLDYEDEVKKKLEENGIIFNGTPKDEAVWQEKAMSIWPKFYSELPDISILDKAMEVLGKQRP